MKKSFFLILITGLMTCFFSQEIAAQDSVTTKSKKAKIVLKINKNDNGKTTVIDTVINLSYPYDGKEFEKAMQKYEAEIDQLQDELENIEVYVDIPDFPDSLINDSVVNHMRCVEKNIRCPRFKGYSMPHEFDYKFEAPSPQELEDLEGYWMPGRDMRTFRFDTRTQTLSDLLGDIPMGRVKSYKIKDKKNGKQIIIDLNDGPILEKNDRVIIIREPDKSSGKRNNSDRQMKVIIKSDDERHNEKPTE
jgi:hypothetical protein